MGTLSSTFATFMTTKLFQVISLNYVKLYTQNKTTDFPLEGLPSKKFTSGRSSIANNRANLISYRSVCSEPLQKLKKRATLYTGTW